MTDHQEQSCSVGHQDLDRKQNEKKLEDRMSRVKHKLLVMSGKGGVGKSTVAVNLAFALAAKGKRVGLLDIDIHGPSIPVMLGLEHERPQSYNDGILPIELGDMKIMSIGFLLPQNDDAIIWRGPMKMGAIEQFLRDVEWGELDFLVVDAPPGTGDEPLSVGQLLPDARAVIVTTPQKVSTADVRKSISFCRTLSLPVVGVVENMNGLVCPKCGEHIMVFPHGEAEKMAREMNVPFLVSLPMDPQVAARADQGNTFTAQNESPMAQALAPLVETILALESDKTPNLQMQEQRKENAMRIAIPTAEGTLCNHFGHCEQFAFFDVEADTNKILNSEMLTPPPHEPGVIPRWVAQQGANLVLAGGMGGRAIDLFVQAGVQVMAGCPAIEPEKLVEAYFNGSLTIGANACGHDGSDHNCGGH